MPIVTIVLRDIWTPLEVHGISEAVHEALVEAFRIPEHDHFHRIDVRDASAFALHEGTSERFVLIEMAIFPGRSPETKARLYAAIASRLARFGVRADDQLVVLHEQPLENWGRGGRSAAVAPPSFRLDV